MYNQGGFESKDSSVINEGTNSKGTDNKVRISYSVVVGDLFHYGHLQSLLFAKSVADLNFCGVLTDEVVESYRSKPVANFQERFPVFQNLRCVDRTIPQIDRDPTENLKRIHAEFPDAEIILVHGDDLNYVHGSEYVKSIGGRLVKHPYYDRLSSFKIINQLIERKDQIKDIKKFSSLIKDKGSLDEEDKRGNKFIISSKADTLSALKPLLSKSKVEDLFSFTTSDWKNDKETILATVQELFQSSKVVVRSSALKEDGKFDSMAGYFESVLNVETNNKIDLEIAISKVLNSYKIKNCESSFNQVLVQRQTENILMSGVIFTRSLEKNGPYYVINYDDTTGSTDSVTAGRENKMVMVAKFSESYPEEMKEVLFAVKEIEETIPFLPLDIEFAVSENQQTGKKEVIIFQVRPLAVNVNKDSNDEGVEKELSRIKQQFRILNEPKNHLSGTKTIFADMPDWNPAEIIGDKPRQLDYSLYDYIITGSAWHQARTSQFYHNVAPARLVHLFGSKPYVDVRSSLNSFVPASVPIELKNKLINYYLQKLEENPHLQDKIEFSVAYTCYDLMFNEKSKELSNNSFNQQEIETLRQSLLELTNKLISESKSSIESDLTSVHSLKEERIKINQECSKDNLNQLIVSSKKLLDSCQEKGTIQFSRLARLGFIAKIIMKSFVHSETISQDFYDRLFNSISTVATEISDDFLRLNKGKVSKSDFIINYGHLRPGTYDITSARYDANPDLILDSQNMILEREQKNDVKNFQFNEDDQQKINFELQKHGINCSAKDFIKFVKDSTQAREKAKFEFTKNLSDALELIAKAGDILGFTREEIAMLDIQEIFSAAESSDRIEVIANWKEKIKQRLQEREVHEFIELPSIICSELDFDHVQHYQAKPNFITSKQVETKVINIDDIKQKDTAEVEGNIVVLENGDPGYDWIFTRNPAGLITKYGGVASHMSIRCAEFGIPAAIGCGELIFNKIKNAQNVLLDCKENKILTR